MYLQYMLYILLILGLLDVISVILNFLYFIVSSILIQQNSSKPKKHGTGPFVMFEGVSDLNGFTLF